MRIQCDACGTAAGTAVVCCVDEAALCVRCDIEIHTTNKLAGKHERLPLNGSDAATMLPHYDVCQRSRPSSSAWRIGHCSTTTVMSPSTSPAHSPATTSGSIYGTGADSLLPKGSSKPRLCRRCRRRHSCCRRDGPSRTCCSCRTTNPVSARASQATRAMNRAQVLASSTRRRASAGRRVEQGAR
jgi:hypothetical protein